MPDQPRAVGVRWPAPGANALRGADCAREPLHSRRLLQLRARLACSFRAGARAWSSARGAAGASPLHLDVELLFDASRVHVHLVCAGRLRAPTGARACAGTNPAPGGSRPSGRASRVGAPRRRARAAATLALGPAPPLLQASPSRPCCVLLVIALRTQFWCFPPLVQKNWGPRQGM